MVFRVKRFPGVWHLCPCAQQRINAPVQAVVDGGNERGRNQAPQTASPRPPSPVGLFDHVGLEGENRLDVADHAIGRRVHGRHAAALLEESIRVLKPVPTRTRVGDASVKFCTSSGGLDVPGLCTLHALASGV